MGEATEIKALEEPRNLITSGLVFFSFPPELPFCICTECWQLQPLGSAPLKKYEVTQV